jgi:hypothetical protein
LASVLCASLLSSVVLESVLSLFYLNTLKKILNPA